MRWRLDRGSGRVAGRRLPAKPTRGEPLMFRLVPLLLLTPAALAQQPASEATAVLFTRDGKTLITSHVDGTLRFHDGVSGKWDSDVKAHAGGVFGLALSPDGKLLATAG